jgi:hypothetical protein
MLNTLLLSLSLVLTPAHARKNKKDKSASTVTNEIPASDEYDLKALSARARTIVVGEVLTSRVVSNSEGVNTVVSLLVTEVLRGKPDPMVEFSLPGGRTKNADLTIEGTPNIVEGYHLLVFMEGNQLVGLHKGMFKIEAGFAWRPKKPGMFLSPRADRDWVDDIDPNDDYTFYSLTDVRKAAK